MLIFAAISEMSRNLDILGETRDGIRAEWASRRVGIDKSFCR